MSTAASDNKGLGAFAILTAFAALVLISLGGLVTSHGAGLAVPDWPTTYGYNMFLFPVSRWVGGIFFEHTHRLMASVVGLLTAVLAIWLWVREPRRWVRRLGVIAFLAVLLQGLLGGLRVVWLKDQIGIFHAILAQLFFILLCAIALFCSRWWRNGLAGRPFADRAGLRGLILLTTAVVFCQLVVGATMRQQHAGLAIPDFPLAYHKLWPPLDSASIAAYNARRADFQGENAITAAQIILQMTHRAMALAIFVLVIVAARRLHRQLGPCHVLSRFSLVWVGLILVQIALGAFTIWSNKAADVATAHVVAGALTLATGALLTVISFRVLIPIRASVSNAGEAILVGKPAGASAQRVH